MPAGSIFSDRRGLFAIATLCCLLWGSAVPAVKWGYGLIGIMPADTPSLLLFAGLRFVLAGMILLGFCVATGRRALPPRSHIGGVVLLALLQSVIQYLCYYVGLAHTTATKTSIISATLVFFPVLLAHFVYSNDKLTAQRILGCLVGFGGVVAVNMSAGGFDLNFQFVGEGMLLASTFSGSVAALYGRRLSRDMDVVVMAGWQLFLGGAVLTGTGLVTGGHFERFSIEAGALVLYLAAGSAIAFALWSQLLKHNPVSRVAVFNFEIPIAGVLFSGLILGETIFEWKNLVALVLVTIGITIVTRNRAPAVTP